MAYLPANTTLTNGTGTFSATFNSLGSQTLTATDTVNASITGVSGGTRVTSPGLPFSDNFTTPSNQLSSSWTTQAGGYQVGGERGPGPCRYECRRPSSGVSVGNLTVQANVTVPAGGVSSTVWRCGRRATA